MHYTVDMLPALFTPIEIQQQLAYRFKVLRLTAGYKRSTLAKRAGVSEASLKRFENSGEVSLKTILRLANVLGCLQEFNTLFQPPEAASLAELKATSEQKVPKRGKF